MRPSHPGIRFAAALIVAAGLAAAGVSILAEELGLGAEAARGTFGWKRIALLAVGTALVAIGALLLARPRIVSRRVDWERMQGSWERMRRYLDLPTDMRALLRSWRTPLIASGVVAIAAFVPRAMTAGRFRHVDEIHWMGRSDGFATALHELDFSAASATTGDTVTMPGVTTMWLGTIARGAWELGRAVGIVDEQGPFAESALGLHLSQLAVAAASSVLIALFVLLAWRWAGAIVAIVAGVLLATEPLIVTHGARITTDGLAALFGATGVLALLIALGVPRGGTNRPRAAAILAGVLLAGSVLSKLSALLLAPGVAAIVAWALVRAGTGGRPREAGALVAMRPVGGLLGIVLAAGTLTTLLAWPAIWADPVNQVRFLHDSAGLASSGNRQFFLGEVSPPPRPLFYLVATPFRMTPWFLIGTVAVIVAAVVRATRPRLTVLAVVAIPAFVGISLASTQFDRYVLVVLPFLALALGLGINALWSRFRHGPRVRQLAPAVAGTVIVLALAHAIWLAPWGGAYFNPLLGAERAERTVPIGFGQEFAGEWIRQREAPACDVTIADFRGRGSSFAFPCGSVISPDDDPDYVVIPIDGRQKSPEDARAVRDSGRIVGVAMFRGITYAEIVDPRESPPLGSE